MDTKGKVGAILAIVFGAINIILTIIGVLLAPVIFDAVFALDDTLYTASEVDAIRGIFMTFVIISLVITVILTGVSIVFTGLFLKTNGRYKKTAGILNICTFLVSNLVGAVGGILILISDTDE